MKTRLTKQEFHDLLSALPEKFTTKEAAESRAEYLRIGTYANSYVREQDGLFLVIKVK